MNRVVEVQTDRVGNLVGGTNVGGAGENPQVNTLGKRVVKSHIGESLILLRVVYVYRRTAAAAAFSVEFTATRPRSTVVVVVVQLVALLDELVGPPAKGSS